jgi:hypothetical protein
VDILVNAQGFVSVYENLGGFRVQEVMLDWGTGTTGAAVWAADFVRLAFFACACCASEFHSLRSSVCTPCIRCRRLCRSFGCQACGCTRWFWNGAC